MVGVFKTGAGNLSDLTIDANLAMGAYDITLGAGQTVDGEDVSNINLESPLVTKHYKEESVVGVTYIKKFEVKAKVAEKVRITGTGKYAVAAGFMKLYVNGGFVENIYHVNQLAHTAFAFTSAAAVSVDDLVQIYLGNTDAGGTTYMQDITLSFEIGG